MMSPAVRGITDNPKNDHNAHHDHNDDDHDDDSKPVLIQVVVILTL